MDELAKVMPVLSEKEQTSMIGADHYYSPSGFFLGTVGTGNAIRIIDNEQWCVNQNGDEWHLNNNPSGTSNWDSLGDYAKEQIVKDIGQKMGVGGIYIFHTSSNVNGWFDSTKGWAIGVNSDSNMMATSNLYDFQLLLVHEDTHRTYGPNATKAVKEYEAYFAMINHPAFANASPEYQDHVRTQLNAYASQLGTSSTGNY